MVVGKVRDTLVWISIASSPCGQITHPWEEEIRLHECIRNAKRASSLLSINSKNHEWFTIGRSSNKGLSWVYLLLLKWSFKLGTYVKRDHNMISPDRRFLEHLHFGCWPNIRKLSNLSRLRLILTLSSNKWMPSHSFWWTTLDSNGDERSLLVPPSLSTWWLGKKSVARTWTGKKTVCGPRSSHESPTLSKKKPLPNPQYVKT